MVDTRGVPSDARGILVEWFKDVKEGIGHLSIGRRATSPAQRTVGVTVAPFLNSRSRSNVIVETTLLWHQIPQAQEANMSYNFSPQIAIDTLTRVGLKMLGAVALLIIGRMLIKLALALTAKALNRQHLDATILRYINSALSVTLNIILVVALLGFFGVQTTTFAALLAGVGIAIGAAWSGLLANFAAGIFLVLLRPFKVGDFVTAGGVTGTIDSIGLFGTTMNTPDNVRTIVGNNKILSDNIHNFSMNAFRRVDLVAQIAHDVNYREATNLLKTGLTTIPHVLVSPRRT